MKSISLNPAIIRRFPDPLTLEENEISSKLEHIIAVCRASSLPPGIPLDPNPRTQKTDRSIYKDVKESLKREKDSTFFLKNKGITIIAKSAEISDDKKLLTLNFSEGDGIVDGGHTYKIIQETIEESECPPNQFVKIEILTGLPEYLNDIIAEGLNTAVQVQQMSLSNLRKSFDWIKDIIRNETYFQHIAFMENENKKFDARDMVAILTLFNIGLYPENAIVHPKIAYTSKAKCLEQYLLDYDSNKTFLQLKPILKDILYLYDYINHHSRDLYNKKFKGKGGALAFYQQRQRGEYEFIFSDETGKYRLYDGALFPILASLRYLIEKKSGDDFYSWKLKSFKDVLQFFGNVGGDLINITKNTSDSKGRNPNAIGKDDNHWAFLYQTVGFAYLQKYGNK